VAAPRTFKKAVGNPRDGPHLAAVSVTAKLKIYARTLGLLKVVRLVNEGYGISSIRHPGKQILQARTAPVAMVIASDNSQRRLDESHTIDKQADAGILVKPPG
jgi:hypothetical protein